MGQGRQYEESAGGENVPAGQVLVPHGVGAPTTQVVQTEAPVLGALMPAGQGRTFLAPMLGTYVFTGVGKQDVAAVWST